MEYQVEKWDDIMEELDLIFDDNWDETGIYQDKVELSPDYEKYLLLEELGALHTVTAREDDKLVGYYISVISPHLHYKEITHAVNDMLYLIKDYRKGRNALNMFKYAEEDLKNKGVSIITIGMRVDKPFDSLCKALGYTNEERVYSKYIGD